MRFIVDVRAGCGRRCGIQVFGDVEEFPWHQRWSWGSRNLGAASWRRCAPPIECASVTQIPDTAFIPINHGKRLGRGISSSWVDNAQAAINNSSGSAPVSRRLLSMLAGPVL